jgi:glycosyltransferase involved in cell wall biosynthesis
MPEPGAPGGDGRGPVALLVSTTAGASNLAHHLGSADYSYGFVWRAMEPVLRRIGPIEVVGRPESQVSYRAKRWRSRGYRPVHLALHPAHQAYLPGDVPTVLVPFWEFPRIPDRAFGHDTRQNWARVAGRTDRIVAACRLTAEAFRRAGVPCPIDVRPVPIDPACFATPDWDPGRVWSLDCRHLVLGAGSGPAVPTEPERMTPLRRIRVAYGQRVRPWLSDAAHAWLKGIGRRLVRRRDDPPPPRLPVTTLTLQGLTYLSVFNFSDLRKNPRDLLTAFLRAFADRPDVTLVLKIATNPRTEAAELGKVKGLYDSFGLRHRCRVAVIADYLEPEALRGLHRAATYYLNTSRAEGACLPLQEALAAGRPAVAPTCSAMADYLDDRVGFPVASTLEPTHWPHDPEQRVETTWARLSWASLRDRLRESAAVAERDPSRYQALARTARTRMRTYAGHEVLEASWRRVLLGTLETAEVRTLAA